MEPGPSELPTDEDAPITTGTSTDRGSTVPVRQPAAYHETTRCIPPLPLHPPQPCKRRLLHEHNDGRGDSALQDALRFMHEGSRPTPATLSERRQFAARHPRRHVTQPVALTVSITRNKRGWRGRRIAESADRAPLGEVVMQHRGYLCVPSETRSWGKGVRTVPRTGESRDVDTTDTAVRGRACRKRGACSRRRVCSSGRACARECVCRHSKECAYGGGRASSMGRGCDSERACSRGR